MYEDFAEQGITEAELRYARSGLVNGAAFYTDTPSKRLNYEVHRKLSGYDPLSLIPHVRDATLDQVNAAASAAFHPDALFSVMVGTAESELPAAEGEKAQTLLGALRALLGEAQVTTLPYDHE
jgi:predicted Zn-dependent peptidase